MASVAAGGKSGKTRIIFSILLLLAGIFFCIPFSSGLFLNSITFFSGKELNKEFWGFGLQHFGTELIVLALVFGLSSFLQVKSALIISTASTVLLFFIFLSRFSVNIPITDDYFTILDFSNNYFSSDSVQEKLSLFVSFYDESRRITLRSLTIGMHFFSEEVNIKWLILIANCCLPLMLFLFHRSVSAEKNRWGILLIIALLLFQFASYDSVVFANDGIQYQFLILFMMGSLFMAQKKSLFSQIIALILGVFSVFSYGNGLLVFPLVMLFFIIEKRWKLLFLWLAASCVVSVLYLWGFPSSGAALHIFPLKDYFIYSCCFLGSGFQFMYQLYIPFFAGLLVWILFAFLTIKKYYKKNFFIYGLMLFVLISSLAAAQFRLSFGLAESISNRYGLFSLLVFSASIIALFQVCSETKQKILLPVSLSMSVSYHLLSGIFFFPEVPVRKQKLEKFINEIKSNNPFTPVPPVIPEGADQIVKESMKKDIYFP